MKIVKQNKLYYVRRWCLGWQYLDCDDTFWWFHEDTKRKYCAFNTVEEARQRAMDHKTIVMPIKEPTDA